MDLLQERARMGAEPGVALMDELGHKGEPNTPRMLGLGKN